MKTNRLLAIALFTITTLPVVSTLVLADEPAATRYGLFGLLDHRSAYGQGAYPEPFLVDDTDLEETEVRLDWTHTEAHNDHNDVIKAEYEKGIGPMTLEIEAPYEIDRTTNPNHTTDGFNNIDLGVRCPFYQYVSENKLIDTTFGIAFELGVPTYSSLSQDFEIVPKLFNDTKVDRFTLQSLAGYSILSGPGDEGGMNSFEYGFVFGYTIPHEQLPLPHVLQLVPVFELSGETQLNNGDAGHNILTGNAAVRFNMKPIGTVQPRLGVGYIFPIDNGARDEMHWGVITSLVFEY